METTKSDSSSFSIANLLATKPHHHQPSNLQHHRNNILAGDPIAHLRKLLPEGQHPSSNLGFYHHPHPPPPPPPPVFFHHSSGQPIHQIPAPIEGVVDPSVDRQDPSVAGPSSSGQSSTDPPASNDSADSGTFFIKIFFQLTIVGFLSLWMCYANQKDNRRHGCSGLCPLMVSIQ